MIIYFVQAFLSFFCFIGCGCVGSYLPNEWVSANFCVRFFGCVFKGAMFLMRLVHYVILIFILIIWYGQISGGCGVAVNFKEAGSDKKISHSAYITSVGASTDMLLLICGLGFIFAHVGGGLLRGILYTDPHFEIPDEEGESACCKLLFV